MKSLVWYPDTSVSMWPPCSRLLLSSTHVIDRCLFTKSFGSDTWYLCLPPQLLPWHVQFLLECWSVSCHVMTPTAGILWYIDGFIKHRVTTENACSRGHDYCWWNKLAFIHEWRPLFAQELSNWCCEGNLIVAILQILLHAVGNIRQGRVVHATPTGAMSPCCI